MPAPHAVQAEGAGYGRRREVVQQVSLSEARVRYERVIVKASVELVGHALVIEASRCM